MNNSAPGLPQTMQDTERKVPAPPDVQDSTAVSAQNEKSRDDIEKGIDSSGSSVVIAEPAPQKNRVSIRDYWLQDIDVRCADWLLFGCCITTGLLDLSAFRNWGTFVSMQTGNTVILCLSTAGLPAGQPFAWAATLISLCAFFLGAFVCTRVATYFGTKRRITVTMIFFLQACLITVTAALASARILALDGTSTTDAAEVLRNPHILIGIGPLSFQSGATIAASRLLGFGNEIPVTVYTSTYAALAGDPNLFALPTKNKPRDRRVIAVICIFSGALIATWLEARSVGAVATFWMSAGIKFLIAAAVAILFKAKVAAPAKAQ